VKQPTDKAEKKIVVLDTSAFVAGFDPFSINEEQYTVPMVREEIRENSIAWIRFKTAVDNGKIKVVTPDTAFLDRVKTSAAAVGDTVFLSEADVQVLALALGLKTEGYSTLVVTDDYSMQNVANQMNVQFTSLATFGIRFRLQWMRYCPACHKKYPPDHKFKTCQICGTELKRKPIKRNNLHSNNRHNDAVWARNKP
jgi:UPF0271 protein